MKNLTMVLAIAAMSILLIGTASAQIATQNLSLTVGTIYKMDVSGDPAALTISEGTAGTDALTAATDASTTYSITHNNKTNPVKITAKLDAALPTDITLKVTLASAKGTSVPSVDISDGNAAEVVSTIAKGADATQAISYSFEALASAGTFSGARLVTLTLSE